MTTARPRYFTCLLAAALFVAPAAPGFADDWLYFRGPNFDGSSNETGWQAKWPQSGPKIAWRKQVGVGASSVTVKGGRVVTMGNQNDKDVITCLNADTGGVIWTFAYDCRFERRMFDGGTAATPTIDDGRVYTFSHKGDLYCLSLEDGKVLWHKDVVAEFGGRLSRWEYACSPFIMGDYVYLDIGGPRSTVALNKHSGAPYWGGGEGSAGYASPVPLRRGDELGLLVFKTDTLIAHNAEHGEVWWTIPWGPRTGVNATSPLVLGENGDKIVVSCGYGEGGAMFDVSGETPRRVWRSDDMQTKTSQCVHLNGYLYTTNERGNVVCIDAATGETKWSQRGFGQGTVALADGKLIILGHRGELAIAEATHTECRIISRAQVMEGNATCWVVPVLANGRIYCRSNRGELVCVDVR